MAVLTLLLLLAATRVELVDEVFTIPPSEWRYVEVQLKQTPVTVHCTFQVEAKGKQVRVALLRQADLERLRADQAHGFLAASALAPAGRLSHRLETPGEYAVVVDNRALQSAEQVHLRVSLDFAEAPVLGVRTLSPERRLTVILISFAVFFGIVAWSGKKLLRAMKE
jgi:hypothetical protein